MRAGEVIAELEQRDYALRLEKAQAGRERAGIHPAAAKVRRRRTVIRGRRSVGGAISRFLSREIHLQYFRSCRFPLSA
ncbi:hypothetical protein BSNK01_02140 [Bacillaceae bacterium]